jgi:ABC-type nitrate/sulfonate/bicarbonate transport system substrate-binding protein
MQEEEGPHMDRFIPGCRWTIRAARSLACLALLVAACSPAAPPAATSAPAAAPPAAASTTTAPVAPTAAARPTTPPTTAAVVATAQPTVAPAAPATAAAAPTPNGPLTQLAVSYPEGGAHLPLFLARDTGIFTKYGLDVTLNPLGGGPVASAALLSGGVQISDITGSEIINADANGADLVALATLDPVYPYVFEVSKDIQTKEDLIGKTIAVRAAGDATDIATRVMLKNAGIDPNKDVTILAVDQPNARVAALQNGQICCSVAQVQDRIQLEQQFGFHTLFDLTSEGLPNAQGVIAAQRSWVTAHPEATQGFINALVAGIARMKADKTAALPVLKNQLSLDDDAVASATYDFFAKDVVPSVPLPAVNQFADGISILSDTNEKVKGFDVAPYIDTTFVQKAVALGLDKTQ